MQPQKRGMTLQTLLFLLAAALFLIAIITALDLKSTPYIVLFIAATAIYAISTVLSFFGKVSRCEKSPTQRELPLCRA